MRPGLGLERPAGGGARPATRPPAQVPAGRSPGGASGARPAENLPPGREAAAGPGEAYASRDLSLISVRKAFPLAREFRELLLSKTRTSFLIAAASARLPAPLSQSPLVRGPEDRGHFQSLHVLFSNNEPGIPAAGSHRPPALRPQLPSQRTRFQNSESSCKWKRFTRSWGHYWSHSCVMVNIVGNHFILDYYCSKNKR